MFEKTITCTYTHTHTQMHMHTHSWPLAGTQTLSRYVSMETGGGVCPRNAKSDLWAGI